MKKSALIFLASLAQALSAAARCSPDIADRGLEQHKRKIAMKEKGTLLKRQAPSSWQSEESISSA